VPKRVVVQLSQAQAQELEAVRHHHPKPYMRERAAAVLKVAQGASVTEVAESGLLIQHEPETVRLWIDRYLQQGLEGWKIRAGRGRKAAFFPTEL
jgi:transposase